MLETTPQWYALHTHSHCEGLVQDQLRAKGMHVFLPELETWSKRGGATHLIKTPMFPSYLFVHHAMDKLSYVEIKKVRGLVRILGGQWDRLIEISEPEIWTIRMITRTQIVVLPHPYLREGQRVRITAGPLKGIEGILLQKKPSRGLFVISVDLLQRSVAVEVDSTIVEATLQKL